MTPYPLRWVRAVYAAACFWTWVPLVLEEEPGD